MFKTMASFALMLLCPYAGATALTAHYLNKNDPTAGAYYLSLDKSKRLQQVDGELFLISNGQKKSLDTWIEIGNEVHEVNQDFLIVSTTVGASMLQLPQIQRIHSKTGQVQSIDYPYKEIPDYLQSEMERKFDSKTTELRFTCQNSYRQPNLSFSYRYTQGKISFLGKTGQINPDQVCQRAYQKQYLIDRKMQQKDQRYSKFGLSAADERGIAPIMDSSSYLKLLLAAKTLSYSEFKRYCQL